MNSQLRKIFGLALVFALVFGMVSAERAVAQTDPLDPVDCPEGDTIMVNTNTFLTVEDAEEAAMDEDEDATERQLIMQELFNCAIAVPGSTLQFADGTYDDVGSITIGDDTNKDGDDPDTEDVTEKMTVRGNSANREAVKFTGKVNFVVQANNVLVEYLTFEDTENIELLNWPRVSETLEVGQAELDADKCRENVEIRNCVFRNTRKNGISYFTGGSVKAECTPSGLTVADSLFENIGYNNEWEDGFGPGDTGTGIPKLIDAEVSGATTHMSGTTPHQVRDSRNSAIRITGAGLIKNVTITNNTVDGTTHSGMQVHGVTGVASRDEEEESDKIEISNNSVSNVPKDGIHILESPTTEAAGYDLVVSNNIVEKSGNSPWVVADYALYTDGLETNGVYSPVKSFLGAGATPATDNRVDGFLKPEIWDITGNTVEEGTTIFGREGAPVNIYNNFGGAGGTTDARASEYRGNGNRVATMTSKIPASGLSSGNYADMNNNRADSCIGDDSGTDDVNEEHFACFSIVRFLNPYVTGAIQLNGVSTEGNVRITQNELRDNTLGLVLCGGSACYFDNPYSPVPGYENNAAFSGASGEDSKVTISMNNIHGASPISENDLRILPFEFSRGAVYASIGALENKVDLSGNYLGASPRLFTDLNGESLQRSPSDYALAPARLDIQTGPGQQPAALGLETATFTGDTLTLTYNKALDEESVPAPADFTIMVGGEAGPDVTEVAVSGTVVTLTLASAVEDGDEVTVSYTPGENPIRDASGTEDAPMLADEMVSVSMPPMPPGEEDDDGCALASGGSGVDLGMLLALMVVPFGFAAGRRAREAR